MIVNLFKSQLKVLTGWELIFFSFFLLLIIRCLVTQYRRRRNGIFLEEGGENSNPVEDEESYDLIKSKDNKVTPE